MSSFRPAACALLVALSSPASAQLVINGSFEQPGGGFGAGLTSIPGWTASSGEFETIPTAIWQPFAGDYSIDLNGVSVATIFQDVLTSIGSTYSLTFALAGNPYRNNNKSLNVVWGSSAYAYTFTQAGTTPSAMNWQVITLSGLVASATTTRLQFQSTTYQTPDAGPALDDVSLVETTATPEPASLALLGTGLLAAGALMRRRRR